MALPGTLDPSFGTNGLFISNQPLGNYYSSLAVQPDRKVLLTGMNTDTTSTRDLIIMRVNENGTLDASFGTNGIVTIDYGTEYVIPNSIIVDPDGKIVVAGVISGLGMQLGEAYGDFILVRCNSDGSFDASFGTNGKTRTSYGGLGSTMVRANDILRQPDGKYIIGALVADTNITGYMAWSDVRKLGLARYNSNGTIDASFGTNGLIKTDFVDFSGNQNYQGFRSVTGAVSIELQSDGKIVTAGAMAPTAPGTNYAYAIARYNQNGTLDTSFGQNNNGLVFTVDPSSTNIILTDMKLHSNDKILALGVRNSEHWLLIRYNTDGTLDNTFGPNNNGFLIYDDPNGISAAFLTIQPNQRFLVSGSLNYNPGGWHYMLNRYNYYGFLDTTFAGDGRFRGDLDPSYGFMHKTVVAPDGKIVFSGTPGGLFAVGRLIGDPLIPTLAICFPAGTPVTTDQGIIPIEQIVSGYNTIRNQKIIAVTKTTTIEKYIVCIEKDSFGPNIPSQKTFISRNHKLLYNKQMIKAKDLIGVVDGVNNKKYNGEILYNVLLEKHDKMIINNLIVETMDPENVVAKLYNGKTDIGEIGDAIVKINNAANDYKKVYGYLK